MKQYFILVGQTRASDCTWPMSDIGAGIQLRLRFFFNIGFFQGGLKQDGVHRGSSWKKRKREKKKALAHLRRRLEAIFKEIRSSPIADCGSQAGLSSG